MLLPLVCILATAAAAPASDEFSEFYDQRQDGESNVQGDIKNIFLLVALPSKMPSLFDIFSKSHKPLDNRDHEIQERSDVRIMEAFVEPSTPYRVEIGDSRSANDGRAAEVVIAGRRRMEGDLQEQDEVKLQDEIKLLGAIENCGPDRERDPVSLTCKERSLDTTEDTELPVKENDVVIESQQTPEVVVISS